MSKKEDIIQTALDLFNCYSYGSVGVDRITLESNVAKGTFYKHFGSKEKLIESCLIRISGNIQNDILAELELCQSEDYLGKIKAIYDWYTDRFKSEDFNGCMFQKAAIEVLKQYPSIMEPIAAYRFWLSELLKDLLIKLQVKQPDILSSMFINILDGMTVDAHINHDYEQIAASWKYLERLIFQFDVVEPLEK